MWEVEILTPSLSWGAFPCPQWKAAFLQAVPAGFGNLWLWSARAEQLPVCFLPGVWHWAVKMPLLLQTSLSSKLFKGLQVITPSMLKLPLKVKYWAELMAPPVRCLPRGLEHLHLDPPHPCKSSSVAEDACYSSSHGRDKREPRQIHELEAQQETGKIDVEIQERPNWPLAST